MRRRIGSAPALLATALLAGCAPAPPKVDRSSEERAIRALDEVWGPAVAKKDVTAIVGLYASDGVVLWQDRPAAQGTDAIRAAWTEVLQAPGLTLEVVPQRVVVSAMGDLATDHGHGEAEADLPSGHVKITRKYLHVWRKENGQWRLLYDMSNSYAPASPPR